LDEIPLTDLGKEFQDALRLDLLEVVPCHDAGQLLVALTEEVEPLELRCRTTGLLQ